MWIWNALRSANTTKVENEWVVPAYSQRFHTSEFTQLEWEQLATAERNGYVRSHRSGPHLWIDFLPITDASRLPDTLVHVTSKKNAEVIRNKGLHSHNNRIYLQSPAMKVEPEGVSLWQSSNSLVQIEIRTADLLKRGRVIILDPESLHGYLGEFMHSFVVYGEIEPGLIRIRDMQSV